MTRLIRYGAACLALAWAVRGAPARADDLDVNGDGMIRIALVSAPLHAGGIDAAVIAQDLAGAVQAAKTGKPVRVVTEPLAKSRTLLGWWYHPDTRASRAQLAAGSYDYLLLAESEEIIRGYPELFFEGVRAVSAAFAAKGTRVALVLLAKPASTFRDKRAVSLAETAYRVGDGCGVSVVPAAFAWMEALQHNHISGDSPIKARAYAYLAAAALYCDLADARLPKVALETDWTTKKTCEVLAASARDAMARARVEKHYSGPFEGIVRIEPRIKKRLRIYVPNTAEDDPLRVNLQFILDAAFQDWFWRTPADWYANGFDRNASAFDLVYADTRQMDQFLDPESCTAGGSAATNWPAPCVSVFCRNPEGDAQGGDVLRGLESVLIEGYDYAKSKHLAFIPYQIAWARAWQEDHALVSEAAPGRGNDWLSYMLANMIYTLVTDRYQPPPEKDKPHLANPDHPHGYHERCARIGYDTMRQLARLSARRNAVILRTETYRVDSDNPGFASVRLLDRPASDVQVFCATDEPSAAALSRAALLFTPDTYNIEQSVRILPATNRPTLFFNFMVSAQSEDKAVDGASDKRPFLLNYDEAERVSFSFARDSVSPITGFDVPFAPAQRPSDQVCVSVVQHGQVTEEIYFSHDHYGARPVRLCPTAADYQRGLLKVTVQTRSADRRFNGRQFEYAFRVSAQGLAVPQIRLTAPAAGGVLDGPAFVTARAEAAPAEQVASVAVFLGPKCLGRAAAAACAAAVEQGPPQSRLPCGEYTLWAVARSADGVVVATEPHAFTVRAAAASAP
jgi:hypothetical protein